MNLFIKTIERNTLLLFLLFWFLSALFLLIISNGTSPANPYYLADSSAFYLVGRGILHGLAPYRDIFDHKGPLLYCIYALGEWLIPGKSGVFLLQAASTGGAFTLLYRFFRLYAGILATCLLLALSAIGIAACIGEGALTEEWSLPLSLLPLYLVVRHLTLRGTAESLSGHIWLLTGLCCAAHFLLRVNNASPVCGLVLALSLILLLKGQIAKLSKGLLLFGAGLLLPLLLSLFLLAQADVLGDFVQSYLSYNFAYLGYHSTGKSAANYLLLGSRLASLFFLCAAGAWLVRKGCLKMEVFVVFVTVAAISALALVPLVDFSHYYMTYIPALACAIVLLPRLQATVPSLPIRGACLLCALASLFFFLRDGGRSIKRKTVSFLQSSSSEQIPCTSFSQIIPKEEQASFLGFNVWPMVYLHTDIMPCHRYCFIQTFLSGKNPAIERELEDYFKSENAPKWVAIPYRGGVSEDLEAFENAAIREVLEERYERVSHAGQNPEWDWDQVSLYHRIK